MIKIFFLLCLAFMATDVFGDPGLLMRFDLSMSGMGSSFFIKVEHTLDGAKDQGYKEYDPPSSTVRENLVMYCNSTDLTVCPKFDSNGVVGGLQVAFEKGMIVNTTYDWETRGFTSWEAEENGTMKEFWVQNLYFMSKAMLALSDEEREAKYNSDKLIQEDTLWLTGFNSELMEVPDSVSGIKGCGFTEQNCVVWMGRHYFWNMTADTVCSSDTIFPYFMLEKSGIIVGTGLIIPGVLSTSSTRRVWYEEPAEVAVKFIVKDGPECLYNLASDPGMITMHIYFISDPYWNVCVLQ